MSEKNYADFNRYKQKWVAEKDAELKRMEEVVKSGNISDDERAEFNRLIPVYKDALNQARNEIKPTLNGTTANGAVVPSKVYDLLDNKLDSIIKPKVAPEYGNSKLTYTGATPSVNYGQITNQAEIDKANATRKANAGIDKLLKLANAPKEEQAPDLDLKLQEFKKAVGANTPLPTFKYKPINIEEKLKGLEEIKNPEEKTEEELLGKDKTKWENKTKGEKIASVIGSIFGGVHDASGAIGKGMGLTDDGDSRLRGRAEKIDALAKERNEKWENYKQSLENQKQAVAAANAQMRNNARLMLEQMDNANYISAQEAEANAAWQQKQLDAQILAGALSGSGNFFNYGGQK